MRAEPNLKRTENRSVKYKASRAISMQNFLSIHALDCLASLHFKFDFRRKKKRREIELMEKQQMNARKVG